MLTPSQQSPDRAPSPSQSLSQSLSQRPLTPLSYLSSPVPDLAATLHTQAAEEADEANVAFLRESLDWIEQGSDEVSARTRVDPERDPRRSAQSGMPPQPPPQPQQPQRRFETDEDLSRRERLQRVLARLNRMHEPAAPRSEAYSNRTPEPHAQSLYDWAPSHDEHSTQNRESNELDAILGELRRQQQAPTETGSADILRMLSQNSTRRNAPSVAEQWTGNGPTAPIGSTEMGERRERLRERERRRRENEWVSLRARAALQRSRQEGSPSATDRMLRYVLERERSGLSEEEDRARGTGWFRPSPTREGGDEHHSNVLSRDNWMLPPPSTGEFRDRERQERVEAFRRGYLAENVPPRLPRISTPSMPSTAAPTGTSSLLLENALKYLSDLRACSSYEEALLAAIDHGLATKEFFADKHDDFITDLTALDPIPYSSWLQPGMVFDGHQHAMNRSSSAGSRSSHSVEQINPHYATSRPSTFDHPPGSTRVAPPPPFDATRPWLSHVPPTHHLSTLKPASPSSDDHWPVRVILHSVDSETMTLQGTMEAYDVPQHPVNHPGTGFRPKAGKKSAPITTYLEGHILSLTPHTFLTPPNPNQSANPNTPTPKPHPQTFPYPTLPRNATPYTTSPAPLTFPASSPPTDAKNWLNLPPFNTHTTPTQTAQTLLSTAALKALNNDYIFMRWKEKCFIHHHHRHRHSKEGSHAGDGEGEEGEDECAETSQERRAGDQDRGHGLTISGFYYVSLCRATGEVEGLYYDPSSTPFQRLRLRGSGAGCGAFGFA